MRWSPNGELLASASMDGTLNLLDFKSGKSIQIGKAVDGSKRSYNHVLYFNFTSRSSLVCLLHIDDNNIWKSLEEKVT